MVRRIAHWASILCLGGLLLLPWGCPGQSTGPVQPSQTTRTPTSTGTATPPQATFTATSTLTLTATRTFSATSTATLAATSTATLTRTRTATSTGTATSTFSPTSTSTAPASTATMTFTRTPTQTSTSTLGVTATPTTTLPCSPSSFGKTLIGGSVSNPSFLWANVHSLAAPGTIFSLSIHIPAPAGTIRLAVYSDSAAAPQSLLGETPAQTSVTGWNTLFLTAPATLAPGNYWLAYQNSSGPSVSYDFGAANSAAVAVFSYGNFPTAFPSPSFGTQNFSLYASFCQDSSVPTPTPTATPTGTLPTNTPTRTATSTRTLSSTRTATATFTSTPTGPTSTSTFTPTVTPTWPCAPATFGETAVGGSATPIVGLIQATNYLLSNPATIYTLSVYLTGSSSGVRLAVYSNNSGVPQNLLAECPTQSAVGGWNTLYLPAPVVLPPGNYWLACQAQSGSQAVYGSSGPNGYAASFSYGVFPGTFPASGANPNSVNLSINASYCYDPLAPTYTATASFSPTHTRTSTPSPTFTLTRTATPTLAATFSPTPTPTRTKTSTPTGPWWKPVGPGLETTYGSGAYLSLCVDSSGPHVAFSDLNAGNRASVKRFNGSSWVNLGSAGFSAGQASYTRLRIDGGVPYLAYVDSDVSGDKASVLKYEGGNWNAVGTARFSPQLNSGLDFDVTGGTPYVEYRTWDGHGLVMMHDGSGWVTVGGAEFDFQPGSTALTLDYAGWPVVAYVSSGQMLWVRRNAGVAYWNEFLGGALASDNAFGLSAWTLGRVHYLAYTDVGNGNKVTVKKYDTLQPLLGWVAVGSPGITPGQAYAPSVCADGSGVYVAYQDLATSPIRRLSVMKHDGFGWSNLGSAGISSDAAYGISISIYDGVPYVAYLDSDDFQKVTVLKYE